LSGVLDDVQGEAGAGEPQRGLGREAVDGQGVERAVVQSRALDRAARPLLGADVEIDLARGGVVEAGHDRLVLGVRAGDAEQQVQ